MCENGIVVVFLKDYFVKDVFIRERSHAGDERVEGEGERECQVDSLLSPEPYMGLDPKPHDIMT